MALCERAFLKPQNAKLLDSFRGDDKCPVTALMLITDNESYLIPTRGCNYQGREDMPAATLVSLGDWEGGRELPTVIGKGGPLPLLHISTGLPRQTYSF